MKLFQFQLNVDISIWTKLNNLQSFWHYFILGNYVIKISFSNKILDHLQGVYRTGYIDREGVKHYQVLFQIKFTLLQ